MHVSTHSTNLNFSVPVSSNQQQQQQQQRQSSGGVGNGGGGVVSREKQQQHGNNLPECDTEDEVRKMYFVILG